MNCSISTPPMRSCCVRIFRCFAARRPCANFSSLRWNPAWERLQSSRSAWKWLAIWLTKSDDTALWFRHSRQAPRRAWQIFWVFAKQSGGDWKLVSECWSSDLTLTNAESDVPKSSCFVSRRRRSARKKLAAVQPFTPSFRQISLQLVEGLHLNRPHASLAAHSRFRARSSMKQQSSGFICVISSARR